LRAGDCSCKKRRRLGLNAYLNRLVRAYLAHCPVTEGKKGLLRLTKKLIRPADPQQTATTKHGFRLRLNLANPEQERIYFYGEHDERYETALLKKLLRPGMQCWDIGANIGYYTCLFALLAGTSGRVVAFEPAAATRERLAANVKLNEFQNVMLMPCAVGAAGGTARIHYSRAGLFEGTASLLELKGQGASEEVAVETLDALVARLGAPDFLKIDVEGAQLDVWRGGSRFFASQEALVMAELHDSNDPAVLRDVESTVRGFGYQLFTIRKGGRLVEHDELTAHSPRNFLLIKPGARSPEARP